MKSRFACTLKKKSQKERDGTNLDNNQYVYYLLK